VARSNYIMRIPKHPNIIHFDGLVLDIVDSDNKVVGFLT
jgi:hypothetical protein